MKLQRSCMRCRLNSRRRHCTQPTQLHQKLEKAESELQEEPISEEEGLGGHGKTGKENRKDPSQSGEIRGPKGRRRGPVCRLPVRNAGNIHRGRAWNKLSKGKSQRIENFSEAKEND